MKLLLSICLLTISFLLLSCVNKKQDNQIDVNKQKHEFIKNKEVFSESFEGGGNGIPLKTQGVR